MLLATTANILPEVSLIVPCSMSSGITRQRLPLVQLEGGRLMPPSLATIGLTNGSRRPCAPKVLGAGLGFSAGCVDGPSCVTCGAGALAGDFVAAADAPAFLVPFCAGLTAITAGFAALPFFVSTFLASPFLASVFLVPVALAEPLAATTGVGTPLACVPAGACAGTGTVAAFTAGLLVALDVLGPLAAADLSVVLLAGVPALVLVPAAFFVAGCAVPPVFAAAAGVGVGLALAWMLALGFCAVATVAKAVASARICMSFISIPFGALFIKSSLLHHWRRGCRLSRLGGRRCRLRFRLMAEESRCNAARQHCFARSIRVRALYLGRAAALGVAHLHIADVDDPLQLGYALKEIQHRVIRSVDIDGKRHFTVKLLVAHRHGGVAPDLNA